MIAASWAPIEVTGRSSAVPVPATGAPPKPAKRTLATERFIAVAISIVRIVPEEPTRVPATISATLSSAKPAAAAESPGEGVQQRDHHRHVGAADRQHDEVAEQGRGDQDRDEETLGGIAVVGDDVNAGGEDARSTARR